MQINSGLRSILALLWVYRLFAHILGIKANRQWLIDDVLGLRDGQKLVDVGFSPTDILDRLPGVEYVDLISVTLTSKLQGPSLRLAEGERSHRAAMEGFGEQHLPPRLNEHRDRS
jgi:hypothetical protein